MNCIGWVMENGSHSRAAYIIAGSALAAYGVLRGNPAGIIAAIAGGGLAAFAMAPERTRSMASAKPTVIQRTVTVTDQPIEAYTRWRNLENAPTFLNRLKSVEDLGGGRHSWAVRGKLGLPVTWETEIVNDQPGHLVEWRSVEGSPIKCSGLVRFTRKRGGRGTKVHIQVAYVPASGFSAEAFNQAVSEA
jgi:uncharacterized membrane protein